MYDSNRIKDVVIEYDINNPNYYEADIDGLLFVSKKYLEIKDDLEYINMLIEKGYDRVASNGFDYCMNDRCFSDSYAIYKFKK